MSISASFSPHITRVSRFLQSSLERERMPEICRRFVDGGKRLRAQLFFASAIQNPLLAASTDAVRTAGALELVHAASLVHDDIVDRCEIRRGAAALHRVVGTRGATFRGFHIIQLALNVVADLPDLVRRRIAVAAKRLSRGQFIEIVRAYDAGMRTDERLTIIQHKTASIFGLSCELGGVLIAEDPEHRLRRRQCGEALGVLFQIADDLDDLFGSESELGRPPGADLVGGVASLPLTCALETDARLEVLAALEAVWNEGTSAGLDRCREVLRASGAITRAEALARRFADEADRHLTTVPPSEGTEWIASLVADTRLRCQRWLQ